MGQCKVEFVWEKDDMTKQKSGRGASLTRSRITDMERRVVQRSKPRQQPAHKVKDKRGSVDRRGLWWAKGPSARTGADRDVEEFPLFV
jgi:hypothetical protein